MNNPKEKARELVEKYHDEFGMMWYLAKRCALIAVDEIIMSYDTKHLIYPKEVKYWQQVKQEIEKL